ncbi:ferredoxin [Streptomyces albus]|uniref:Ferredoxin n=1 Tax=Streptomyces albus (strain ATCC 21838 / DSM 41398 / FERM P-419 / JCM 4703 / NBRC 107858) TaxID=1081613 RepID=A0A0B5EZL3_STRA4|nr:ferredoxin [Streptomyces albus]AOU81572.1 ferredoxin [Streptomyces albus]AYN37265.1 ferredoxin [Streptomyces albus]
MTHINYVLRDGSEQQVDVPDGQSVMDGSVRNNLPGIIAECGGSCSCATCHVYLDPDWSDRFDEATDEERELLEFAEGASPESRLACQLIVRPECEGARVTVAVTE